MMTPHLRASCLAMSYLTNADRVRAEVNKLVMLYRHEPTFVSEGFKITAVHLENRRYQKIRDYILHMNELVTQAVADGSQVVVFPELSGMLPLTLMPSCQKILESLRVQAKRSSDAEVFAHFCQLTQGFVGEIFFNTFSQLAQTHKIILCGASVYCADGNQFFNRQYLFTETGEVGGMQDKLFLSPEELRYGLSAGSKLLPVACTIGQVALLTASATRNFEPFAIAGAMGCVLATIGASPFLEDVDCAPFRAEEAGLCLAAAGCCCKGSPMDLAIDTPPCIFVPSVCSKSKDGLCNPENERSFTVRVDLEKASGRFDSYSADRNPEFYRSLLQNSPKPPASQT